MAHARLVSIDTTEALAHPKVHAVITGKDLEGLNLAWAPTLSADVQAVLATDKVRFQGQEVAFVVAEDRYAARDALELIDVEYEELPPVIDARQALDPGRRRSSATTWRAGPTTTSSTGRPATRPRPTPCSPAPTSSSAQEIVYPRVHPAPMETCGAVADYDPIDGKLTALRDHPGAARPPHAVRDGRRHPRAQDPGHLPATSAAASATRSASTPATSCAVVGSIVTGKPVKWVEDRSENLMSTSFARDYIMTGRDRGDARTARSSPSARTCSPTTARSTPPPSRPSTRPASSTSSPAATTSQAAHCSVTGVYTNKAPGGVAYACSFRVTEAVYLVERMVDVLAARSCEMDPAELRLKNFIRPEQFPYANKTGWEYDSGDYEPTMRLCDGAWPATTTCAASRPRSAPAAS